MKKLFFLAATLCGAMALNATTIDFTTLDIDQSKIHVTNGTISDNTTKSYFEIKNTEGETVEMTIDGLPNMKFTYKNSAEKTAFTVAYKSGKLQYITFNGDQRDLTISNLAIGDKITLSVGSKGSTANSFEDSDTKGTGLTNFTWVSGNKTQAAKGEAGVVYENITIQAIATSGTLRCTAGGYNLNKVIIGLGAGLEETAAPAEVKKVIIDGKMYIRNAAGELVSVLGF